MRIRPEVFEQHLTTYPDEEGLLKAFLPMFDVTWGQRRRPRNTEVSAYFLKPHPHTQEAFGFEQELLLVYSPYMELQPRTIQAAEQLLRDFPAGGRVERLTFLLVSDMPDAGRWVQDYVSTNQETRLIAGFSSADLRANSGDAWYVRNQLAKQFFGRDLFDFRLPLKHDTYFFGREAEVLLYRDAIKRGENRGLFGLRKTGKTSLLFKVERVAKAENIQVIYTDCKTPEIRNLRWFELLDHLAHKIDPNLNRSWGKQSNPTEVARRFGETVKRVTSRNPLVLIFDEIEYISPLALLDPHWRQDFISFWQTLWSYQSRQGGLSLILAGVNPTVTEQSAYDGVQNPLFGIVSPQYLRGLAPDETKRMVRTLGKRMGLNFEQDAIDYLQERCGGHPLLTLQRSESFQASRSFLA